MLTLILIYYIIAYIILNDVVRFGCNFEFVRKLAAKSLKLTVVLQSTSLCVKSEEPLLNFKRLNYCVVCIKS